MVKDSWEPPTPFDSPGVPKEEFAWCSENSNIPKKLCITVITYPVFLYVISGGVGILFLIPEVTSPHLRSNRRLFSFCLAGELMDSMHDVNSHCRSMSMVL